MQRLFTMHMHLQSSLMSADGNTMHTTKNITSEFHNPSPLLYEVV